VKIDTEKIKYHTKSEISSISKPSLSNKVSYRYKSNYKDKAESK